MAGKNQVTMTLAADAAKLEREVKRAESANKGLSDSFDKVGKAADRAEDDIKGFSTGSDRLQRAIGKGGADMAAYRRDLDGVGDGFNDVEDRAMGAGNILNGVNDMMTGGDPATFAMGLSDLAAGIRYTVVPSLQDAGKALGRFTSNLSKSKAAMMAGAAGFAALGAAAIAYGVSQMKTRINTDELTAALSRQGTVVDNEVIDTIKLITTMGDLEGEFRKVLEVSPELADEFIRAAEAAGMNDEGLQLLEDTYESFRGSVEGASASIKAFNDRLQAQTDPVFAAVNAMSTLTESQRAVRDAQVAVSEAVAEYGTNSPEHVSALQALESAEWRVAEASVGQESAMLALADQMLASGVSVDQVKARMLRLAEQNGWTAGTVQTVINKLNAVPRNVTSTLRATDLASTVIESIRSNINRLPREVVVNIRAEQDANRARARSSISRAQGGPVYAAEGTVVGGPRGTDTVPAWLTPGELVLNRAQQGRLFAALDGRGGMGGTTINVIVQGSVLSERDLVRVIRDEQTRGGLR